MAVGRVSEDDEEVFGSGFADDVEPIRLSFVLESERSRRFFRSDVAQNVRNGNVTGGVGGLKTGDQAPTLDKGKVLEAAEMLQRFGISVFDAHTQAIATLNHVKGDRTMLQDSRLS